MAKRSMWKSVARRGGSLLAGVLAAAVLGGTASASGPTFNGRSATGLGSWISNGGAAQCANYGTPSKSPRLRGFFYLDTTFVGQGTASGRFDLPADTNSSAYPLEVCDLLAGGRPLRLGTDGYYGLMLYVPQGWTIANKAFFGVEIKEFHFQNVYGAPISFQLHPDHVTLSLQTGACSNHSTSQPGCAWHSNADNPGGPGNLPASYAIPRGALEQGAWNEILMHVRWASDSTGQIQTWYKVKGAPTWTQSANVTGVPTVQWDVSKGCCYTNYADLTEAYTAALTAPLSVWMDDDVSGPTFSSVALTMP